MRKNDFAFVGSALLLLPALGSAVTVRDDVTTGQSAAYAAQSQFESVGQIGGASGVLISDQWVLTAWHVARGFAPNGLTFSVNGTNYQSSEIHLLADAGANINDVIVDGTDLALVRLAAPVVGVTAANLFGGTEEIGNAASFVGFGGIGNGTSGVTGGSGGVKHGMRNMLDLYTVNLGGGNIDGSLTRTGSFMSDFDNTTTGANIMGDSMWMDLEGNVSPGDSGGGLFIEQNGQFLLAGIASFRGGNSGYGSISGFTSVSWNQQWIQETSGVPEPASIAVMVGLGAIIARRKKRA